VVTIRLLVAVGVTGDHPWTVLVQSKVERSAATTLSPHAVLENSFGLPSLIPAGIGVEL